MKITEYFFAASMAANLVLVTILARGIGASQTENMAEMESTRLASPTTQTVGSAQSTLRQLPPTGVFGAESFWTTISTHDLEQMVKQLRDAGFPPDAVAVIARAIVAERAYAHRADVVGTREATPYWQIGRGDLQLTSEQNLELSRRLGADHYELQRLVGTAEIMSDSPVLSAILRRRFGDLPLEKLSGLMRIEADYMDLRRRLYDSGSDSPQVRAEKAALLEAEFQQDMKAALTAEQYADYQLRSGPTASSLRVQLDLFQPTEEEFKALHALHEAVRVQHPDALLNSESRVAWRKAMEALAPQIEAVLGPERHADYQQTLQDSSRRVNNLLLRLDLPLRTGAQFEELRKDYTQRAEAVRNDPQLPPTERDARLNTLAQEARQRIAQTLGSNEAVTAYEAIKGWVRDLQPKP